MWLEQTWCAQNQVAVERTQYCIKTNMNPLGFSDCLAMGLPPQCLWVCFGELLKPLALGCSLFPFQASWLGALTAQTLQDSTCLASDLALKFLLPNFRPILYFFSFIPLPSPQREKEVFLLSSCIRFDTRPTHLASKVLF